MRPSFLSFLKRFLPVVSISLFSFGLFIGCFGLSGSSKAVASGAAPGVEMGAAEMEAEPLKLISPVSDPILSDERLVTQEETLDLAQIFAAADQTLQRASSSRRDLGRIRREITSVTLDELQTFVANNPASGWTPSLQVELGKKYRSMGRFTRALVHWENAWKETGAIESGVNKLTADRALVYRAHLLASLGRAEELAPLVREHQFRILSEPHLAQIWARTIEAYVRMVRSPGVAYLCGTHALNNASQAQSGRSFPALWDTPSSPNGFSLAELHTLSETHGLDLVPAVRTENSPFIFPAVVHWKQNHYAAIKAHDGEFFLVEDPTFRTEIWMDSSALEEESSGYFLIPKSVTLPAGWRYANRQEASQVFGKGLSESVDDDSGSDPCPLPPECCEQGPAPSGTGGEGDYPCGMPTWRVQEPNINLEVSDIPMAYNAAFGPDFVLKLKWRQRNRSSVNYNYGHFGDSWECDLLAWVDGSESSAAYWGKADRTFTLHWGNGFLYKLHFAANSTVSDQEYLSGIWAVRNLDQYEGVTNIVVYFRNGAVDSYNMVPAYGDIYRLERRQDATGQAISFAYDQAWGTVGPARLRTVTLADGAAFNFSYDDNADDKTLIRGVTGPNTRSVSFSYSTLNFVTVLTGVTDVAGISSSFVYDATRWWITSLVTPYGTNSFGHVDNSVYPFTHQNPQLGGAGIDRSLVITEPDRTSKQVYLFYNNDTDFQGTGNEMSGKIPTSFAATQIPDYLPNDPPLQTLDVTRHRRNSHFWNRQQAATISAATLTNLPTLTSNDYKLSRTRHWLVDFNGLQTMRTFGWELPPSPDGVNEAQPVFYDYVGKPFGQGYAGPERYAGTRHEPAVISQRMLDGSTYYKYFERNSLGMRTLERERWEQPRYTVFTRENTFSYATGTSYPSVDNLLLLRHIGPSGVTNLQRTLHGSFPDRIGTEKDASGAVTTFQYYTNASRLLYSKQTQASLLTTYTYDSVGRLTNEVDSISGAGLRTNRYTWSNGYMQTHTDARNLTRTFSNDLLGRVTQVSYPDSTTETFEYFMPSGIGGFNTSGSNLSLLDLITYKDRLGNKSRTLPNRIRQTEKIIEPSKTTPGSYGTEHTLSYCGCGSPSTVTRWSNSGGSPETTNLDYDYQGKITRITLPNSTAITNRYDLLGRLSIREDALRKLTNVYDNLSRVVERRNGAGLVEGVGYDRDDRVTALTNSSGVLMTNLYDNLGRVLVRGYPSGGKDQWSYTLGFWEATRYLDGVGHTNTWAYNAAQWRTNEIGVGVYTNSFAYTPGGDLRELLDGKTNRTVWVYDTEGRMMRKTNQANVLVQTNGYNANGQLTARWTPAKLLTSYSYDGVRNLTFVNYPATTDITYQYNALSRLTNMIDAVGTTKFTYTTADDLLTEDGPWNNDTITYGYHANVPHLRTSLSLQQPSGTWSQTFGYDSGRRLQTVTSPAGTFTYSYSTGVGSAISASMLWKKLALFNGGSAYITNVFDTSGRLTATLLNSSTNVTLNSHGYGYNQFNQRTNQTFFGGSTAAYSYDTIGQLKVSNSSINSEDRGYVYDAAWNLNVRTNDGVTTTFAVNVKNELSTVGVTACTYDSNGNITSDGTRSFSYNDENQLTSVSSGTSYRHDFVYDGFGRKRKRIDHSWSGSSWTPVAELRYVYDGRNVIQEHDGGGNPTVGYTRGWDLSGSFQGAGGIGGMLARSHNYSAGTWSTHHGYHADGSGNITAMISTAQAISANYKYDSFGNLISSSGTMAGQNIYRFGSKELNLNAGIYYYGFRFYHPTIQRWLNNDPYGELLAMLPSSQDKVSMDLGTAIVELLEGPNLQAFVENDPINSGDADGRGKLRYAWLLIDDYGRRIWKACSDKEARRRLFKDAGDDIRIEGKGSSGRGRKLANEKWPGEAVRHDGHGPGGMKHWQRRTGGDCHIFYRCTAVGAFGENGLTSLLDVFNPMSDINDLRDMVSELQDRQDEIEFLCYTYGL